MKITGFIWIGEFVDKLESKHNVYPEEAEQLFANNPKILKLNRGKFRGEDVFRALGRTEEGRYLVVFFIRKRTNEAITISARDMDPKERRSYAKK